MVIEVVFDSFDDLVSIQSVVLSEPTTLVSKNHPEASNFHTVKGNSDKAPKTQAIVVPQLLERKKVKSLSRV